MQGGQGGTAAPLSLAWVAFSHLQFSKSAASDLILDRGMGPGHTAAAVDHRPVALDCLRQHLRTILAGAGLGQELNAADVLNAVDAYDAVPKAHCGPSFLGGKYRWFQLKRWLGQVSRPCFPRKNSSRKTHAPFEHKATAAALLAGRRH